MAMRFLHTSDWHLGKPLRNHKRDAEYEAALQEVLDIAKRSDTDCILIAGDVFDSIAPPPEAERMFFEFLREVVGLRVPAVIVGGNHDHPHRLEAFSRVLDLVDVHVRGESVRPEDGGVVEVYSRDRATKAVIAMLPWVPERKAREWATLTAGGSERYSEYAEEVARRIRDVCALHSEGTVNLLLAHVFLSGSLVAPESGERPLHMGDTYAITPQRIPSSVQYAALGHVHNPKQPTSFELANAYYCGSLLQCDFGEAGQEKRVNIVDVKPGAKAKVEHVPLSSIKQLRNVGTHEEGVTLDEIKALAQRESGLAADVGEDYLKVFLKLDAPVPGLAEQVHELLPNAVDIVIQRGEAEEAELDLDLNKESPPELFSTYYRSAHGSEPPKELMALFSTLYEEATAASD